MPELANRKDWVAEIRREFAAWGKKRVEQLLKLLGNPPNPDNVPAAFWRSAGKELRDRFEPILKDIYLDAAKQMMADAPIVVDWSLTNSRAATWASTYSFRLVKNIEATTQQRMQDIFNGFFRDKGTTVADLRRLIAAEVSDLEVRLRDGTTRLMTSAERARLIATTEVTRAAVEGERQVINQIEDAGIEMIAIWETQRDAKVCDICEPRQGKERGDGWTDDPPAHPGCYCDLRYEPKNFRRA